MVTCVRIIYTYLLHPKIFLKYQSCKKVFPDVHVILFSLVLVELVAKMVAQATTPKPRRSYA